MITEVKEVKKKVPFQLEEKKGKSEAYGREEKDMYDQMQDEFKKLCEEKKTMMENFRIKERMWKDKIRNLEK